MFFRAKPSDKRPTSSAPSRSASIIQTVQNHTRNTINALLNFSIGSSLITAASAETCFEKYDHDYSLFSDNENSLYDLLTKTCGIYKDGMNDCANWFTESTSFGKSAFGFPSCVLRYHQGVRPDSCIVKTLQNNCPNGFNKWDYIPLSGIVAGGLVILGCCTYVILKCRINGVNHTPNNAAAHDNDEADLEAPQIEDRTNQNNADVNNISEPGLDVPPTEGHSAQSNNPNPEGMPAPSAPSSSSLSGMHFICQQSAKEQRCTSRASLDESNNKTPLLQ